MLILDRGKSFFVLNQLADYCKKHNMNMLLFSNRNPLKEQNLAHAPKNVKCYNYQSFEKFGQKALFASLSYYDIICFDECHYFFKDSSFNYNTSMVLEYALAKTNQIKIFSSATPEPLFYTNIKFNYTYNIKHDYNGIKEVVFYSDIGTIWDKIIASKKKTFCVMNDMKRAQSLYAQTKENISLICSKSNSLFRISDKEALDFIIKTEMLPNKIAIATTVLDNGVNLKDPKLTNVVIDVSDPITIIQSLGRKRIENDTQITLYLKVPTTNQIHNLRYYMPPSDNLAALCMQAFMQNHFEEITKKTFIGYWSEIFANSKITVLEGCKDLAKFLKTRVNKPVTSQELSELIPEIAPTARITSFNRFFANHNLDFFITAKRVKKDNKQISQWIVKTSKSFLQENIPPHLKYQAKFNAVKDFCKTPKSAKEIRDFLKISSRYVTTTYIINPLLQNGSLVPLDKDNLHSPNQKYVVPPN